MFERFTERARQVVVFAQDEARMLAHNYIGTEHLLLGLMREEEGIAARALRAAGLELASVREAVERNIGRGEVADAGQIPFTPRAKRTLELSLKEALGLGHRYIGTEHILLALAAADDGVALEVLRALGVEPEELRASVLASLGGARVEFALSRTHGGPRFEYRVEAVDQPLDVDWLNDLGADGWELVAVTPNGAVFKRFRRP